MNFRPLLEEEEEEAGGGGRGDRRQRREALRSVFDVWRLAEWRGMKLSSTFRSNKYPQQVQVGKRVSRGRPPAAAGTLAGRAWGVGEQVVLLTRSNH